MAVLAAVLVGAASPVALADDPSGGATRGPLGGVLVQEPLRILAIGDSVTQGFSGDYTWRYRLQRSVEAEGVAVDFVGHLSAPMDTVTKGEGTYADPDFDSDHASIVGMKATSMRYSVPVVVAESAPDVVVINLGVNDVLQGVDAAVTAEAVERVIWNARIGAPGAQFVVAHQTQTWLPEVDALNEELTAVGVRASRATSPVVVAPVVGAYAQGVDTWDRYHPNGVGEVRIAQQVQAGLASLGLLAAPTEPTHLPAAGPALSLQSVTTTSAKGAIGAYWVFPSGLTSVQVAYRDLSAGGDWVTLPGTISEPNVVVSGLRSGHRYELALLPGRLAALSAPQFATHLEVTAG